MKRNFRFDFTADHCPSFAIGADESIIKVGHETMEFDASIDGRGCFANCRFAFFGSRRSSSSKKSLSFLRTKCV